MKRNRLAAGLVAVVLRQLADALRAGLSLGDTLAILGKDTDLEKRHRQFIAHLAGHVASGGLLSQALAEYELTFPPEAITLVRSGEDGGTLRSALDLVATDFELRRIHQVGVKGALAWPITILVVLAMMVGLIMIFVIPAFKDVFSAFGADLPTPTLLVMGLSDLFVKYWYVLAALVVAAVVAFRSAGRRMARIAAFDAAMMRIPFLRSHLIKTFVSRLSHILAHALEGELNVAAAVAYLRATAGNLELAGLARELESQLASGKDLVSAVRDTPRLPGQLAVAVELGAKAYDPVVALRQVVAFSEGEARRSLVRLQQALLVSTYIATGIIVGGTVIALYLPIFRMGQAV